MPKILAVNAGSSTLKWKLFEMPSETQLADGLIDRLGQEDSTVKIKYGDGQVYKDGHPIRNFQEAVADVMSQLKSLHLVEHLHEIKGIGHRVVAGGEDFKESAVVDDAALLKIQNLRDYAPLHNPTEAKYIAVFRKMMPWTVNVAVFDTAFHQTMPAENYLYAIPYEYYERYGARKYGAHGTSVRYVSARAAELLQRPLAELKLIVMHLGSGSSITAVQGGHSVDTSMGFTPLAGVAMGTRSGDVDASVVAYIMNKLNITDVNEMIHILNNDSGLLGISGLSADQRDLEAVEDTDPRAKLALDIFANRVAKYVGSYAAVMNGVDALVFTGGVGENGIDMRLRIMRHLSYLGATVDETKNHVRGKETDLSAADATVKTLLVPTNEELMIVRDVFARL
ncbi:acetate/propionate family kinase [Lacticaseibacillus nasuensis]|uniref:Acetate kinase n=1 Tax=Lacticaseibacillus nasuensis JCM 17158 TaxID=1291734 RepID=A0A0R1JNM3_9LACO|nr:acetate kinase [Lacticaseibacillus nasuensis]KRK72909.1 acetate kinase [Lacticaseibacillus nasuensis JCM 17158]